MSKKRMLADVLWEAANERLAPTHSLKDETRNPFSCNAVQLVLGGGKYVSNDKVTNFLMELGCDGTASQIYRVSGLPWNHRLQGVRYMWLLLAMHVAEDEGITV